MQAGRRQRIDQLQSLVQGGDAVHSELFIDLPAEFPVGRRTRIDPAEEGLQVQGGTANEQDRAASALNVAHRDMGAGNILGQ
jgi:hypothetical protein